MSGHLHRAPAPAPTTLAARARWAALATGAARVVWTAQAALASGTVLAQAICLTALVGLLGLASPAPAAAQAVAQAVAGRTLDLQGHRGARGLAPENTLAGFELAIRLGVSRLELDAAITRDGVLVVHHDLALNPAIARDAQGQWLVQPVPPIAQMDWATLQTYDVGRLRPGSDYARQFPQQQAADGTRIPRMDEVFALIKRPGHEHVHLAIETKIDPRQPQATWAPEPYAQALVAAVRQAGLADRVQILSFDWRTLQVVQRIAPEIPTVYLSAQQRWIDNIGANQEQPSAWTAGFQHRTHGSVPKMVKAAGGRYWSVFHGDLTPEALREAQALGLKVLVWTVNDTATMARWLDQGVDGLITDRPDLALPLLQARGLRAAP